MKTLNSAFIASHSPDGFLLTLYDIMKAKTPKKLNFSTTIAYNCDLEMSEFSVSTQTEQSLPHTKKLELPIQQTEQTPQYPKPDQATQHPLQSGDPPQQATLKPLQIDHSQQCLSLDPMPEQIMSSLDEHRVRQCKFKNGKDKAIKAHMRIKHKKSGFRLTVQPLLEGKPEGSSLEIMLCEIINLYIDSGPSGAPHICIEGFVTNEPFDPRILRIIIYKNQTDQPDPQATYELLDYLKSKLDHPQI